MDGRKGLMQANGHEGEEPGGKNVASNDAHLLVHEVERREDARGKECANGLDDEHHGKSTDNQHEQRGDEGVQDTRHDLADLLLEKREEGACDEGGDHATRSRVVGRVGDGQHDGARGIGRARGKQRHGGVRDAHHARDAAEGRRAAKLTRRVVPDEDGQVGEQRPAHGADALIPPCIGEQVARGNIDDVADAVDQARGDDAGKQCHEHVGDLLHEGLHRLALVLGLLSGLVLRCGVAQADIVNHGALGDAGELRELLEHLVHLAGAEYDLHRIVLDEAHHAV